ncbi:MAG: molybdopterin-guanine dinucleotide biosynthesis protein B [Clostridiales bacterium]|nr:molybdopterin-guanine dinucleotide biosynthesis protein B [Clostridiales bacterium]MCF8021470.1 molybdopterin-guanine dinucleotide biosynthesis protein B [Clostridiales bacterium]
MNKPPVISVVGWSNSGKTTFLEQLVRELKHRGYRVGTIKHHHGDIDKPGKDTWIHSRAGAEITSLAGSSGFALFKKCNEIEILDEVCNYMSEMDIIITEGFKSENKPKIEIRRKGIGNKPAASRQELIALAGDIEDLDDSVPCFSYKNIKGVADLLEEKFFSLTENYGL